MALDGCPSSTQKVPNEYNGKDRGEKKLFCPALVALAKVDACSFDQPYQDTTSLVVEVGIGGNGNGLFLNGGVDVRPFQGLFRHVCLVL